MKVHVADQDVHVMLIEPKTALNTGNIVRVLA